MLLSTKKIKEYIKRHIGITENAIHNASTRMTKEYWLGYKMALVIAKDVIDQVEKSKTRKWLDELNVNFD